MCKSDEIKIAPSEQKGLGLFFFSFGRQKHITRQDSTDMRWLNSGYSQGVLFT